LNAPALPKETIVTGDKIRFCGLGESQMGSIRRSEPMLDQLLRPLSGSQRVKGDTLAQIAQYRHQVFLSVEPSIAPISMS
jgi:hypothetical protein